jgi:MraZ protein
VGTLSGLYLHNVDEKGRLAVPSKMRVELGEPFYITCVNNKFLSVYPQQAWQTFSEKLNQIPQSDASAQRSVRTIFSNAVKCEPDKQGRVLLPQILREKVGIDKEVVTIGVSYRAEIWAKDKWHGYVDEGDKDTDAMQSLGTYGI